MPASSLSLLKGIDAIRGRDRKSPFVLVFFGFSGVTDEYDAILSDVLEDSAPTFPVVAKLTEFGKHIPFSLRHINGYAAPSSVQLEGLANRILETFRLLRSTRRLFISYRRPETQSIAIQLYNELDSRTFDVFLDTHSIAAGEPVQEVLWHRLADTDVVILLESPGFQGSHWTMDELAMANLLNVQILHVLWPNLRYRLEASFSEFFPIDSKAFRSSAQTGDGARFKRSAVKAVSDATESLRARALAARYTYIVDQFCDVAKELTLTPLVQQGRYITVRLSGLELVVVPAVGVPDAPLNQAVERMLAIEMPNHSPQVWIVYDERGIRDMWLEHLAWLSGHAPVKCVQIAECEAELQRLLS